VGTPYEVSPLPDLYQEYVGHDNNRDGYMNNMLESQDVTRTELEWAPVIFYCHHQTAPFPRAHFHSAVHGTNLFEHSSADGCAG
jgi:hypothetical protein